MIIRAQAVKNRRQTANIAGFSNNKPLIVSLESLQSFLADDMRAVDGVIRERLYSDVVLIRQVSEYIINSGGKRIESVWLSPRTVEALNMPRQARML